MMSDRLKTCRRVLAAAMLAAVASMLAATADAQQVVVIVNGDPITALDIEQRQKLAQLSTQKVPAKQEVIDELIDEKLKVREAKRFGLEVSNTEVDSAISSMAGRMGRGFTTDQLIQRLAQSGVNVNTLKHRVRADIAWPQIVRGRYGSLLQIGEKDILTAMESKGDEGGAGYDYTLRPILFLVPSGSSEAFIDGRKREAEALRSRFQSCDDGITLAKALPDVAVREQVN